jgi:hypothetical protein
MNKYRLQAELWEIQIILYWILAFLLLHTTSATLHFLGWLAVGWTVFTIIGTIKLLLRAVSEDPDTL